MTKKELEYRTRNLKPEYEMRRNIEMGYGFFLLIRKPVLVMNV